MIATAAEKELLDQIEPYVLLSASTLITCAFHQDFRAFGLLSRPQVGSAMVSEGVVEFALPERFPVEEALLDVAGGRLHSIVKHMYLQRKVRAGGPGTHVHRFELDPGLCHDGETVSLTYSPWLRFAAPPYRFEIENRVAAYVAEALGHAGRVRGLSVRMELSPDVSVLWLSERLRVEVIGAAELREIAILLPDDETYLSFTDRQLLIARRMFPDICASLQSAGEAGEQFRGASMLIEENQVLLRGDKNPGDVQA